jgi:hypothetical protein
VQTVRRRATESAGCVEDADYKRKNREASGKKKEGGHGNTKGATAMVNTLE